MRCSEEAASAALIGLSESAEIFEAESFPVESSTAALRYAERTVAVLHASLMFPLNKKKTLNNKLLAF